MCFGRAALGTLAALLVLGFATPAHADPRLPYTAPTLEIFRDMQDLLALDPPMAGLSDIPWKKA